MGEKIELEILRPTEKPTVMALVESAGFDVSDWRASARTPTKASANPKYCYEWCFKQGDALILNVWHENLRIDSDGVFQRLNMIDNEKNKTGLRKIRAERFVNLARDAFEQRINPRVIILDRPLRGEGGAHARMLDESPWTIVSLNKSGDLELRRGIHPYSQESEFVDDIDLEQFTEGNLRTSFVNHRLRESKLRKLKLREFKRVHGRIFCQVPRCGFDFGRTYGPVGEDFAEVHHLDPLVNAPAEGQKTRLDRLAVVCSNCHRMIHRGGECRSLDMLLESN